MWKDCPLSSCLFLEQENIGRKTQKSLLFTSPSTLWSVLAVLKTSFRGRVPIKLNILEGSTSITHLQMVSRQHCGHTLTQRSSQLLFDYLKLNTTKNSGNMKAGCKNYKCYSSQYKWLENEECWEATAKMNAVKLSIRQMRSYQESLIVSSSKK